METITITDTKVTVKEQLPSTTSPGINISTTVYYSSVEEFKKERNLSPNEIIAYTSKKTFNNKTYYRYGINCWD